MQSKEYGLIAIDELASQLMSPTLTLNAEQPKELTVIAQTRQPSDTGFWHKVEAEIHLPPDMAVELAKTNYQSIGRMVGERAALDIYELLVDGDTDSADTYLALLDGSKKLKAKTTGVKFAKDGALLAIKGNGKKGLVITFTAYIAVLFDAG